MLCNYLVKDLDTTFWDKLQYCSGNRDLDDGDPTIYIYICARIFKKVCNPITIFKYASGNHL